MPKKRYQSRYTQVKVDEAHYITELICEKIAYQKNLKLVPEFWSYLEWREIFKKQLLLAKALLKIYSDAAIIAALKNPLSQRLYSLGLQSILDPIIQSEQKKIEEAERVALETQSKNYEAEYKPVKTFGKQSTINKLRNL